MASIRQLADLERWPVAQSETGWRALRPLARTGKSPWTESRRRVLEETVEREVLPRLFRGRFAASKASASSVAARDAARPSAWEIAETVRLAAGESIDSSLSHVERIRARGISLDAIFLHLLAPAAHLLGEMWVDDTADFATVTIATSRLQHILRELACEFHGRKRASRIGPRALVVALPGDQHTFGVAMMQEFLRHDGWAVCGDIPDCRQDLVDLAGVSPYRVIGISVSCDTVPEGLASLIKDLRRAALDPRCRVVVGGRLFLAHPDLVKVVGADGAATDAQTATRQLSSLLDTTAV
jgi:MerR family transcriptional regulator, light-induced transcriptional regulator